MAENPLLAGLGITESEDEEEGEESSESPSDSALAEIADDMMAAFEAKDSAALARALRLLRS